MVILFMAMFVVRWWYAVIIKIFIIIVMVANDVVIDDGIDANYVIAVTSNVTSTYVLH